MTPQAPCCKAGSAVGQHLREGNQQVKECHNWEFDSVDTLAWASGTMWQHLATCLS